MLFESQDQLAAAVRLRLKAETVHEYDLAEDLAEYLWNDCWTRTHSELEKAGDLRAMARELWDTPKR